MNEVKKPRQLLKLSRLPARKPVKLSITLTPELAARLNKYAAAYRMAYGEGENVVTLVPYMLTAFIDSDREFRRAQPK